MNVSYNTSIYYAKMVLVRLALLIAYVLSLPSYAKHTLVLTDFDVPQNIGVTPKHIEQRLSSTLAALKPYAGTLYFLQAYTREKIILPKSPSLVVVPVNSKLKYYPWIRDETLGWNAQKSQFVFYNHLPSWIDAFLDVFPHDLAPNTVQVPWGNFIDNGHGLCMVSETDLDLQEKKNIQSEYSKNFGCREVSVVPTTTSLPHPNRHLDIFLQFVSEKKIILASIHKKCDAQDFYIQQLTNDLKQLKQFLKKHHPDLTIQDVPFATCPRVIQHPTNHRWNC